MNNVNAPSLSRAVRFPHRERMRDTSRAASDAIPGFRQVSAVEMQVDHAYQRPVVPGHVARIAREFDPLLFGVILLAQRTDGSYWILDGQQRVAAIRALGKERQLLPCEVLTGLSWGDEARIYDLRNKNRKALSAQEKFKGGIAWGDRAAVEIQDIVQQAGFRLNLRDGARENGQIPGVAALTKAWDQYRDGHLGETLSLIRQTWTADLGPRDQIIAGLSYFLHLYRGRINQRRLVETLGQYTMDHLVAEAREYRKATGAAGDVSFAEVIVGRYNTRLQNKNRLPSVAEMRVLARQRGERDGN